MINAQPIGVQMSMPGILLAIDDDGGRLQALSCHLNRSRSDLSIALDADGELAVKGFHRGLGEHFGARCVAVADALETSCSRYVDVDSIVCIRDEVALFVKYVDCNERHVLAISLERLDVGA